MITADRAYPYWRLSSFYLFYFASLGAILPYWSLYLRSLGFDAIAIGTLIAILPLTKTFAPYFWGWVADETGRPVQIIRLTSVLSAAAFAGVFLNDSFWWLAIVMFVFSLFWNSSLPLFESNTLNHLGDLHHHYSGIRLWGSLGFIVTVMLLGEVLQTMEIDIVPVVIFGLMIGIAVTSFLNDQRGASAHIEGDSIGTIIRQPVVLSFLIACFLMLMSHGPYYTFYSIYLEDHGYSHRAIGLLWAVGVIAEVIIFLVMYRLLPFLGVRKLLLITFLLTALRWLLIAHSVDQVAVLFIAQCLHAFSFGAFHACGITLIHHYFRGRHQARGQAIYSSISFGAGGAIGSFISGVLWDGAGATILFELAALTAVVSFILIWRYLHTDLDQSDLDSGIAG